MRKLVYFTIGFAVACLVGSCIYGGWILPGAVVAFLIAGMIFSIFREHKTVQKVAVMMLGIAVGFGWFWLYDEIYIGIPRGLDGESCNVTVTATDYSYETDYGSAVEGTVQLNGRSYRVKAYLRESTETLVPGDRCSGSFRFRLTTDGGKEEPTNHRSDGIFLLAYAKSDVTVDKAQTVTARYLPALWRRMLLERINAIFPERTAGFACALLLGDRSGIDYELNTVFKVSGISHVIAVSGLHVSILFGLLYTVTAKKKMISGILGIPILAVFAAIVGFTPSIMRACIMQSLMHVATMTNREYDPPTALAFAVLAMLGINPLTILSVSFQLSVGCMIGIFLFAEKIRAFLAAPERLNIGKGKHPRERLKRWFASSVSVTLSAMVTTTPLVAYYFGCVSLIGVLTNLLTLWVISFIFYGIIICLGMSMIGMGLGTVGAWIVSVPIVYVTETAKLLSKVPMAAVYTTSVYVVVWLIGVYGMLGIFLLQRKKRFGLLISCMVITLSLCQVFSWLEPLRDDVRLTVLDVGQGQCILLQSDGKNFMIDCGGDNGEQAADTAAETLISQGITRLDGIILTHYDVDHTGGVAALLTRIDCDQLILPYIMDENAVAQSLIPLVDGRVRYIDEDTVYTFGQCTLTLIAPYSYRAGNESSLCILFQRENCDILITGDRGEVGELMLLYEHQLPELDVLIAGHHGSATSTGEALLKATMPQIVIISVGEENHYGHPSSKVLERVAAVGSRIFRTDEDGTITYRG